jgi:hypothetical protein
MDRFDQVFIDILMGIRADIDDLLDPVVPARIPTLGDISKDSQNVHTIFVNSQTNTNIEILKNTPVPSHQQTVQEIKAVLVKGRKKTQKYVEDMEEWYVKPSIINADDYLYKKLLDGIWVRIKSSKNKKELEKRLREELREMQGKCTMGHVSRLCNILVGFDEDIQPEISVGEHLQNKMSAISKKEITLEEKVLEALTVMEELGIPKEEQYAWIDAL